MRWLVLLVFLVLLAGCRSRRPLGTESDVVVRPVRIEMQPEVRFSLDTGGDQMAIIPVDVGLVASVQLPDRIEIRTVASCADWQDDWDDHRGIGEFTWTGCDGRLVAARRDPHAVSIVRRARWFGADEELWRIITD